METAFAILAMFFRNLLLRRSAGGGRLAGEGGAGLVEDGEGGQGDAGDGRQVELAGQLVGQLAGRVGLGLPPGV